MSLSTLSVWLHVVWPQQRRSSCAVTKWTRRGTGSSRPRKEAQIHPCLRPAISSEVGRGSFNVDEKKGGIKHRGERKKLNIVSCSPALLSAIDTLQSRDAKGGEVQELGRTALTD